MSILKPQSNGPLYSNTVIGTVDWPLMAGLLHFGTTRRGLGGLRPRPFNGYSVPTSLFDVAL